MIKFATAIVLSLIVVWAAIAVMDGIMGFIERHRCDDALATHMGHDAHEFSECDYRSKWIAHY